DEPGPLGGLADGGPPRGPRRFEDLADRFGHAFGRRPVLLVALHDAYGFGGSRAVGVDTVLRRPRARRSCFARAHHSAPIFCETRSEIARLDKSHLDPEGLDLVSQ